MTAQHLSSPRRAFLLAGGSLALGGLAAAPGARAASNLLAQAAPAPTGTYEPRRGQSGKDVIWIPTPDALVTRMLRMGGVTPSDYVIDLGSGDGKIVIAAARAGAQGLGIEYNPDMVEFARRQAQAAGVAERARFEKADIFASDFSRATVITMYLLPHLNLKLRPRLMALKPGTRIVTHAFDMGHWEPDETSRAGSATACLWLVPANVGGKWELRFAQDRGEAVATLELTQQFQNFRGDADFGEFSTSLREPKVVGERMRFALTDADGHLRRFDGAVAGDQISGTVYRGAQRVPFSARRIGAAPPIGGSGPAAEGEARSLGGE